MKIRQIVKKIDESLIENPKDWNYISTFPEPYLSNSRGIDILSGNLILIRDKWSKSTQLFLLNSNEIAYLRYNFTKLAKVPNKNSLEKINKRRAWLVKEVLKTL